MQNSPSSEALQRIKDLAEPLAQDESIREVCPNCEASHERSLSITRRDFGVLYNCHRASCGISGILGVLYKAKEEKKKFEPKFVEGEKITILPSIYRKYLEKYQLPLEVYHQQGVTYLPEKKALCYPIWDYRGFQVGEQLRLLEPGGGRKSWAFKHKDVPLLHFPLGYKDSKELVLVEDIVSCLKVNQFTTCAALLGTNITEEQIILLRSQGIEKVRVILDGDAAGKAYELSKRLAPWFISVGVVNLRGLPDPKDMPNTMLRGVLFK